MDYKARYEEWISNSYFDEDTRAELESIKEDENEIKERFYMDLEFGTAGLRGIIGAGTNRMNIYTVRKATQGLANYIMKNDGQGKGVAIAYDSRHMSTEFAKEAACCLAANGIKAYIFESLRPTPVDPDKKPNTEKPDKGGAVQTGDNFNVTLLIGLVVLAGVTAGGTALTIFKRNKRK